MADKHSGLAFDKASARTFDKDGRLHVSKTHISKACVSPYLGKEIPGWQELGLDPNKIYQLYRDAEELKKAASSFGNLQLMAKHLQVTPDDPQIEFTIGCVGKDVAFNHPYLDSSLAVWTAEGIEFIESKAMKELSPAYHYRADMSAGVSPDGEAFDGRMVDIAGNHVCIVETGRTGPDVFVADSMPIELAAIVGSAAKKIPTAPKPKEVSAMKFTKLGNALKVALSAVSPKIAQDSAFPGLVATADRKTLNAKALAKQVCAMDEDLDEAKAEEVIEAVADVDQPELKEPTAPAKDEDGGKHGEIINYLRSKGLDTSDLEAVGNMLTRMDRPFGEDEQPVNVEEEVKTAMDAMRQEFKALETAKHAVRSTVGDVVGMDSAESVYRFALEHMKVDHKGIAADGLPAVFSAIQANKANVQPAKRAVAMDSAAALDQFPSLSRFN